MEDKTTYRTEPIPNTIPYQTTVDSFIWKQHAQEILIPAINAYLEKWRKLPHKKISYGRIRTYMFDRSREIYVEFSGSVKCNLIFGPYGEYFDGDSNISDIDFHIVLPEDQYYAAKREFGPSGTAIHDIFYGMGKSVDRFNEAIGLPANKAWHRTITNMFKDGVNIRFKNENWYNRQTSELRDYYYRIKAVERYLELTKEGIECRISYRREVKRFFLLEYDKDGQHISEKYYNKDDTKCDTDSPLNSARKRPKKQNEFFVVETIIEPSEDPVLPKTTTYQKSL